MRLDLKVLIYLLFYLGMLTFLSSRVLRICSYTLPLMLSPPIALAQSCNQTGWCFIPGASGGVYFRQSTPITSRGIVAVSMRDERGNPILGSVIDCRAWTNTDSYTAASLKSFDQMDPILPGSVMEVVAKMIC